ncbi:hypothetical protein FB45DRAFT_979176 [Roridomyces roridus]|uniref:Altered inheritance of mitochondria protein 6 n=1 Tax=Roridomyces roridus TaxID=1738132 RepID=A0AAD7BUX1_9AGAR|nr:hypothetical protein FB45DRAFT_979176 [Roridomyces roridus]
MFPFLTLVIALASLVGLSSQRPGVFDEIAMLEAENSTLLQYPTDFTRNIVPKNIHSHNDYWRDVPLLTALSLGVASVEADVWAFDGTLFIGHELAALTPARTFESLYVDPLLSIIAGQNPKSQFTVNQTGINGVFDMSSATTDGPTTLPFVLEALQPLRERGYLTTCEANGTCTLGPLTVVGTGNTPLDGILAALTEGRVLRCSVDWQVLCFDEDQFVILLPALNSTFDITVSPIASTDYEVAVGWSGIGTINQTALAAVQQFVGDAHALGIRARFWDTPGYPIHARDNIWKTLIDNGADWLNADDLEAAANMF